MTDGKVGRDEVEGYRFTEGIDGKVLSEKAVEDIRRCPAKGMGVGC